MDTRPTPAPFVASPTDPLGPVGTPAPTTHSRVGPTAEIFAR
jgi:hypothetical protein